MNGMLTLGIEDPTPGIELDGADPAVTLVQLAVIATTGTEPMARLAAIADLRDALDRLEPDAVAAARPRATLEDVGRALRLSLSTAHRRYGGHREP